MNKIKSHNDDVLLSIVIPAYNSEKYISGCIDSIIKQNEINFEIIIVNDGSTDGTEALCQGYCNQDSRIKLINQNNEGCNVARCKGIMESKGKYILNVDSDDYLTPDAFRILAKYLNDNSYDVIQFSRYEVFHWFRFKKAVQCFEADKQEVFNSKIIDLLGGRKRTITPNVWDKVYLGRILREAVSSYDETISIGEDILMNLHFFEHQDFVKMKSLDVAFYVYRKNVGIMSQTSWKDLTDFNVLKQYQIRFIDKHNLSDNVRFHCFWETVRIFRYACYTLLNAHSDKAYCISQIDQFMTMEFVVQARNYLQNESELSVSDQEIDYINDFCELNAELYLQKLYDYNRNVSVFEGFKVFIRSIAEKLL